MNKWLVPALFLGVVFFDGIVLPSFFGFREGFLTLVFIVIIILYYKADFQSLVFGAIFCALVEIYWGLKTGVLVLPLFVSTAMFFTLNSFFSIRNRTLMLFSGVIMFIVFWTSSVFINKML